MKYVYLNAVFHAFDLDVPCSYLSTIVSSSHAHGDVLSKEDRIDLKLMASI